MRVLSCLLLLIASIGIETKLPASQTNNGQASRPSARACNIAQLSQQIQQSPRNANIYVTRAACYLDSPGLPKPPLQNILAAVPDLETALQLDPQNYYAHHNYAQAAYLLGFDDYAVSEYTKAISLNPKGARSYLGRGWSFFNVCQLNEATADFGQAVRLDPTLQSAVASPQGFVQHKIECSRPPAPAQGAHNCPKAIITAFNMQARFIMEEEWKTRHPGCPL